MGIVVIYKKEILFEHLKNFYKIENLDVWDTDKGMDNSVYFIGNFEKNEPLYVLKIIESKDKSIILNSIEISKSLTEEFSGIKYIKSSSDNYLELIPNDNKFALLLSYIKGQEPVMDTTSQIIKYSKLIARFHNLNLLIQPSKLLLSIDKEFDLIKSYWNADVQEGLKYHFPERYMLYTKVLEYFYNNKSYIYEILAKIPCRIGLTHNDLNTENIIEDENLCFHIIDFDSIDKNGFQLIDLLQAVSKSSISHSPEKIKIFLSTYYKKTSEKNYDLEAIFRSFINWLVVFSLRAMLSTDYYTFSIHKITPEWSKENAGKIFAKLEKSIKYNLDDCKKSDTQIS